MDFFFPESESDFRIFAYTLTSPNSVNLLELATESKTLFLFLIFIMRRDMEEGGDGWDNQRMEEDKEETSIKVEVGKHRYTVEF